MANIKFSQFTVGNTESDIDFVVGYKGANNIQISPANLLSATLSGYLPLSGGTMTGDIILNDDVRLRAGTGSDFSFFHDGSNSKINNNTGNIVIENFQDDADIIFKNDDGSGGTVEYIIIDGSALRVQYGVNLQMLDNKIINIGTGDDLRISHNGTDSSINNYTGNLTIANLADDKDIIFKSDDGSGSTATYFFLDGSQAGGGNIYVKYPDNSRITLGDGSDLYFYHNGVDTLLWNITGDLKILNSSDDKDIIFQCDDGSGGITEYFRLDGSNVRTNFHQNARFDDGKKAQFGGSGDLNILHDGSAGRIENDTGHLIVRNNATDCDIILQLEDNGSTQVEYVKCDSSLGRTTFYKQTTHLDSVKATFGNGEDLEIQSDGNDGFITNNTNHLYISNGANDCDIIFRSDDGSGGVTEYLRLDGSDERINVNAANGMQFMDNIKAKFGTSGDMELYHDGSHSYVKQGGTGDLYIQQFRDDGDIVFQSDDGSGGMATYFFLDGSSTQVKYDVNLKIHDSKKLIIGDGDDLQLYHDATNSYINNNAGNLNIIQNANDKDIGFYCDDGSGGLAEYFTVQGANEVVYFSKDFKLPDNVKGNFGNAGDLKIHHDSSNSFIQDTGTGNLFIEAVTSIMFRKYNTAEFMAKFINDGAVELYYDNTKTLETTSTGIKITGVSEYADNAAAIAAGLTTGDVYRTGDLLKIVH